MNHATISGHYTTLVSKLGKETTESLTGFIEAKTNYEFEKNMKTLATKGDIADLKGEIMKWMFLFWVGQAAVVFGYLYLFVQK